MTVWVVYEDEGFGNRMNYHRKPTAIIAAEAKHGNRIITTRGRQAANHHYSATAAPEICLLLMDCTGMDRAPFVRLEAICK